MNSRSVVWALLLCVGGALWWAESRETCETRKLEGAAAALDANIHRLNTSQAEQTVILARKRAIAAELKAQDTKVTEENRAEAERLRDEIERLKIEIDALPKRPKSKNENPVSGSNFALNQIVDAARLGNTHRIAELITFLPGDEAMAEALFAQLPPEIQAEHGSARHLVASIAALTLLPGKTTRVKITGDPQLSLDKTSVTWQVTPGGANPSMTLEPVSCVFRRASSGDWLLVVSPEMITSYRRAVITAVGRK